MTKKLSETDSTVAINNVGMGNIEGTGVGLNGEPGVSLSKKKKKKLWSIVKRSPPNGR